MMQAYFARLPITIEQLGSDFSAAGKALLQAADAPAQVALLVVTGSYAPGSFVVADGRYIAIEDHLDLGASDVVDIVGTGIITID